MRSLVRRVATRFTLDKLTPREKSRWLTLGEVPDAFEGLPKKEQAEAKQLLEERARRPKDVSNEALEAFDKLTPAERHLWVNKGTVPKAIPEKLQAEVLRLVQNWVRAKRR